MNRTSRLSGFGASESIAFASHGTIKRSEMVIGF